MTYNQFLKKVIEDGIAEVQIAYKDDPNKMKGAIAGFRACEHHSPKELALELRKAKGTTIFQRNENDHAKYWYARMRELQIEFVCNVVSAILMNENKKLIVQPTCRGVTKANEILEWGKGNEKASSQNT